MDRQTADAQVPWLLNAANVEHF